MTLASSNVLGLFGAPKVVVNDFFSQVFSYLNVDGESLYLDKAKVLCAYFTARYLRNPLPQAKGFKMFRPQSHFLYWMRSRMMRVTAKQTALWQSLFKAKNSAETVSEILVAEKMEKHYTSTTTQKFDFNDPAHHFECAQMASELNPILISLRKAIDKAYNKLGQEGSPVERILRSKYVTPSEKSCYERSLANGGGLGHLVKLVFGNSELFVDAGNSQEIFDICRQSGMDKGEDLEDYVASMLDDPLEAALLEPSQLFYDLDMASKSPSAPVVKDVTIQENVIVGTGSAAYLVPVFVDVGFYYPTVEDVWFKRIAELVQNTEQRKWLRRKIMAVLEPLKVRIISKGEAANQLFMGFFQKVCHKVLRRMPCFRLLGKAPSCLDLIDLVDNRWVKPHEQSKWLSSDFTGASDGTSQILSRYLLNAIIRNLPEDVQRIIELDNLAHIVEYPPISKDGVETRLKGCQINGTLMGDRSSFILLCLEVLGTCLVALREYGFSGTFGQKINMVLVNGDDMVISAPEGFIVKHEEVCGRYGLGYSVGKTILHKLYANINSQSYHYPANGQFGRHHPCRIPVFNSGLFSGTRKVKDESGTELTKAQCINALMDSCFDKDMRLTVLKRYLSKWSQDLKRECKGRNLFVSPALGGMGQDAPTGFTVKVTVRQRAIAKELLLNPYLCSGSPSSSPQAVKTVERVSRPWSLDHGKEVEVLCQVYKKHQLASCNKMLKHWYVCSVPRFTPKVEGKKITNSKLPQARRFVDYVIFCHTARIMYGDIPDSPWEWIDTMYAHKCTRVSLLETGFVG